MNSTNHSLAILDIIFPLNQLRDCLQNVFHWMTNCKLMQNIHANNTEFRIIGTQNQRGKFDCFFPTPMQSQKLTPAISAQHLVTFDNNKSFRQHISQMCRCCFYHTRDLRHIRRYMYFEVGRTIVTVDLITAIPFIIILLSRTL